MNPSIENLEKHLEQISVLRDPFENRENLLQVQSYIEQELTSYGYQVNHYPFSCQGQSFVNLIAHDPDLSCADRFIIGAHFDAVPGTPGADDNATGVAALLEIARCLQETEASKQIDFVAFNLEEYGMVGSEFYVKSLKEDKKQILGMLSLEMIGYTDSQKGSQQIPFFLKPFYPSTGDFIALVGDSNSKKLLGLAKKSFQKIEGLDAQGLTVPMKGYALPEVRLSDHSPFWDAGIPALLVTDTSFFRNPHYHSPADRIETLDLQFLKQVTAGALQLAQDLSSI